MKTLKQILEVYSPKSADEKRFVKKHITVKTADVAGNGDDVYSGAKVKTIDRKATRKGYNTPDSEAVYEEEQLDELSHQAKTTMKHIPNASPALKKAAKDIKPGIAGYKDRIDMLKAGGVKEDIKQVDELKKSTVASYIQKKFGKMSDEPVSKNQYGYAKKDAKGIRNAGLRMSGVKAAQKEEVEMNEVLKVSSGAGEWIKDFESSKNPKFAGKSKEQRKQQALAAYYSAKRAGKE